MDLQSYWAESLAAIKEHDSAKFVGSAGRAREYCEPEIYEYSTTPIRGVPLLYSPQENKRRAEQIKREQENRIVVEEQKKAEKIAKLRRRKEVEELNSLIERALKNHTVSVETVEPVEQVDQQQDDAPKFGVHEIIRAVARFYDIQFIDLQGHCRVKAIGHPRQEAMLLARILTGKTLNQIGVAFGNRDHTTILHGVNAATDRFKIPPPWTQKAYDWALSRIEEIKLLNEAKSKLQAIDDGEECASPASMCGEAKV